VARGGWDCGARGGLRRGEEERVGGGRGWDVEGEGEGWGRAEQRCGKEGRGRGLG